MGFNLYLPINDLKWIPRVHGENTCMQTGCNQGQTQTLCIPLQGQVVRTHYWEVTYNCVFSRPRTQLEPKPHQKESG